MEEKLNGRIIEKRSIGGCLSGKTIKLRALELYQSTNAESIFRSTLEKSILKASDGWFSNFLFRWNYVLRRITSTGRELPSDTYASFQS